MDEGLEDGNFVGPSVGFIVGFIVGERLGVAVWGLLGRCDGWFVGYDVGSSVINPANLVSNNEANAALLVSLNLCTSSCFCCTSSNSDWTASSKLSSVGILFSSDDGSVM